MRAESVADGLLEQDVAFAGLAAQAELVRRGGASARELVELALARIERLDGELNAFGAVFADSALADAARADERRARGDRAPLLGVPVAVKDEIDIAGEVTSRGTGAIADRATADAEIVRRLRDAGAIVIGKTTMPELGLWSFTESVTWGVTRNPWDLERTPGGSSGGSAAAVAAGLVPAAIGADGAGSIRIPAACCGTFGIKPHIGRVSRAPHDRDGSHWICFGPLTRSVLDAAILLDVITTPAAGADPGGFERAAREPPARLRVAVSDAFPAGTRGTLSDDVADALRGTVGLLRSLGHEVVERDIDFRPRDVPVLLGLMFRGIRDFVQEIDRPQRLERRSRALARSGALVPDAVLKRLLGAELRMHERVGRLFDEHDVLLTPAMSHPAVPAGIMEGRGATVTFAWQTGWVPFNVLWNSTGQPAASVPAGMSETGLPLAVQLVARPHDEATLLSLAAQLERERPWTSLRPPLS
ncbi:MAG: amidase [Nocardioidaceae bacterium]